MMLSVKNVFFSYDEKEVLKNINIEIGDNEKVAILGGNGSGKSTIAKILAGLLKPVKGEVYLDGRELEKFKEEKGFCKHIQITFQNPDDQIVSYTVEREIAFGLENLATPRSQMEEQVEKILRDFNLEKYRSMPPSSLSGGEKQKLCIAAAMIFHPHYLILDEPTAFLDHKSKKKILEIIITLKNISIILITTDIYEALLCDRILILYEKKIILNRKSENFFEQNINFLKYGIELPPRLKLVKELKKRGMDLDYETAISTKDFVNQLNHYKDR